MSHYLVLNIRLAGRQRGICRCGRFFSGDTDIDVLRMFLLHREGM